MENNFLFSAIRIFGYYKDLGEKAMALVPEEKLSWQYNSESNSIATIVKHLSGNMVSRWTDFLTSDGEKEWRNREAEFDNDLESREAVMATWKKGWDCFLGTMQSLKAEDLEKIIYIRNEGHTVMEAITRQLAHYPYHVGQIIFAAKMIAGSDWVSLSIPRGQSINFNKEKFSKPKERRHFTDPDEE